MFYYGYTLAEKIIGCERIRKQIGGEAFVIMGFQRSGTSLIANLVNSCGIHFGEQDQLKQPLITNPDGFFEHKKVSSLSWKFLKQAGYCDNIDYDRSLNAKGIINRARRLFTILRMHRALLSISQSKSLWAVKNFPLFYYMWREYLPSHKIIAIYRDPYASAHSFMNIWPSKYTYEYVLSLWLQSQKDMIYHISQKDFILIKYEDLIDKQNNEGILNKIVKFVGSGDAATLQSKIKPDLNRTSKSVEELKKNYPANPEIERILEILDKLRRQ